MEQAIAAVRGFNRFFTQLVGALDARFLDSDLTLPEARLLFEIAQAGHRVLAANLQASLQMDAGYLSRILRRLERRGLVVRGREDIDGRARPIALTNAGHTLFATIDSRQRARVEAMLEPLGPIERGDLVNALGSVRLLLGAKPKPPYTIRTFRTGDMGLIAARQSILYDARYGWGREIEIVEGEVTTNFLRNFKPDREQCWVADIDGVMAGSVFLTDEGDGLCRLRLLYVEPVARGLGIGRALVKTCVAFASDSGYSSMTLWTHTILESARRIYAAQGFKLVESEVHETFGVPIQGETWRLDLGGRT